MVKRKCQYFQLNLIIFRVHYRYTINACQRTASKRYNWTSAVRTKRINLKSTMRNERKWAESQLTCGECVPKKILIMANIYIYLYVYIAEERAGNLVRSHTNSHCPKACAKWPYLAFTRFQRHLLNTGTKSQIGTVGPANEVVNWRGLKCVTCSW